MVLQIEMARANPDIETLKLTLVVASGVIGILLVVVGFFLAQQFKVIKTLQNTVNSLASVVEVIKNKQSWEGKSCNLKHQVVDKRLDAHATRLDANENRITRLETKLENGRKLK